MTAQRVRPSAPTDEDVFVEAWASWIYPAELTASDTARLHDLLNEYRSQFREEP